MKNPTLIETLREEVDQLGDANVDYDTYKSLTQVMAVFNEGLRVSTSLFDAEETQQLTTPTHHSFIRRVSKFLLLRACCKCGRDVC